MWQPQGFYNQYVLRSPVILSGEESVRGLYNFPAAKIAVIHGTSFQDEELFLQTFPKKEIRFIRRSWTEEPDIDGLQGTIRELEEYGADTVIAVGGGSVIDGSKLCRLFYEFPYYRFGETRVSGELFKTHFIAVPTTVGSGAEVSSAAVFLDKEEGKKDMVVLHELQPEVVVYDTRYVEHTPLSFLTVSIMDAMAHILEGYVSKVENDFIEVLAEKGFAVLCEEMQKISRGEEKRISYQRLQYGGYVGGLVQNHCIVGAAHGVAHQLTKYGYSHSEAVALLLPAVMRMNGMADEVRKKYNKIVNYAGFSDVNELFDLLRTVYSMLGIDRRYWELKELLVALLNEQQFCEHVKMDKGGKGNPVEITDGYMKEMVRSI